MDIISLTFIFVLGLIVGSFVNVLALRYNSQFSSATGRSICFHCGQKLKWYDLIPILSFVFRRGKCGYCTMPISWQYPIIEFLTGALFVGIALRQYALVSVYSALPYAWLLALFFFVFYAVIFCLLLVILIYDFKHKIIPDGLVYTFIVLGTAKLLTFLYIMSYGGYAVTPVFFDNMIFFHLIGPFVLSIPFALLWLVSGGRWIGLGDAKLIFGIAALLGITLGLSAVVLAFWIGALWGLGLIAYSKISGRSTVGMASEVPFAPFLILGTVIAFFTHVDIFGISKLLSNF